MSRISVSIVVAVGIAFVAVSSAIAAEGVERASTSAAAAGPTGASAAAKPPAERYGARADASKAASPKTPAATEPVVPRYGNPSHPYPPREPGRDTGKQVQLVYRLKNIPATDAANAIKEFLRSESPPRGPQGPAFQAWSTPSAKIVPEPVSNSLLIAGRSDMVDEIRKIAGELDIPSPTVLIEVVIGEAPAAKAKPAETPKPDRAAAAPSGAQSLHVIAAPPQMETIARVRLATLDNQAAFIQLGERVALVGGPAPAPAGKEKQPGLTNVGLILGVTPRISPDGPVVLAIDFEKSQVGPEQEGIPIAAAGNQVVRTPRIETISLQTSVRVPNGQTIVLGSIAARGKQDKELFIVLTPHVLDLERAKKPR